MIRFIAKTGAARHRRNHRPPEVEGLESRVVLSMSAAQVVPPTAFGYVEGHTLDAVSGQPVPGVKVVLYDSTGHVAATARTDARGDYVLPVSHSGNFVVHQVTPHVYKQVVPTFASTAPVGSYLPPYGNSSWNYSSTNTDPTKGPVGPAGWVNVAPAGADGFESPINITTRATDLSNSLTINFNPSVPTQTINNSHQIQVQFKKSATDSATVGGVTYQLAQFHFHDPSETTLHGRQDAMEEHFVMTDAAGAETVVGVFLKVGKFNPALQPVLATASQSLNAPNTSVKAPTTPIDFSGLLPHNADGSLAMQGWFYRGSLTTPPLSQPVNWFVLQKPIELSAAQLQQYETVAAGSGFLPNARPVQPLDGRQLNEIDYNVTYAVTPVTGLNFELTPRVPYVY
jgi:carbonic anhydrase